MKTYSGTISVTSKGVGFVSHPDFEQDIEIQAQKRKTALHGDQVEFEILPKGRMRRTQGAVTRIVARRKDEFVGTWDGKSILPDDRKVDVVFTLSTQDAQKIQTKTKVLIHVTDWKKLHARLVRVIGRKGLHETEMQAIALDKGFAHTFPKAVADEADHIARTQKPIPQEEIAKRRDFRTVPTCTIDPLTAQDFDDALSLQKKSDNTYEIGVHIADVSHYVRERSALDAEAYRRGFSVYLVDRTIPMLPEILSNDLCSLNPNEDRLAFSAVFTVTDSGDVTDRWFGKTVIRSHKRFTYEEAQGVLDAGTGILFDELRMLRDIARKLRSEKFKNGAIDFDTDELVFELDPKGVPISIKKKERLETHKLIEDFMLLANREVAEYMWKVAEKKGSPMPFLYRIHAEPNQEKISDLAMLVRALGYELKTPVTGVTSKEINNLLAQIEGKPEAGLIRTAAIRSMAKAAYAATNSGHFGLAFEFYTHFTSPIRRYADLIVHRMLGRHLHGEKIRPEELELCAQIANEVSEQEISAAEAERESKKYKQVEYMARYIGAKFSGVISGVTEWGIYVEETNTKSEGLIHVSKLSEQSTERGEDFEFNQKQYALVGTKSKKKYQLGDQIDFQLMSVDLEKKQLDFDLAR